MTEEQPLVFSLKGVNKTFQIGTQETGIVKALQDIDLAVKRGSIYGIIGLSGAGKSTLVRCLNLLETPDQGKVLFEGKDLLAMSRGELLAARKKIGMIFQNFNLLAQRTSLENVCFPLELTHLSKAEAQSKARALLTQVGLADKEEAYPSELSGGQCQRLAIARALANNPSVILCDEPTSALDPATTKQILALLKEINQKVGVSIVIITHQMEVIESICDEVAVMEGGRIVEQGTVRDVFVQPKSKVAKNLIFPKGDLLRQTVGDRCLRIVYDGQSALEPVISNMTLACQAPINILSANSRNINGISYGQMIVQIPEEEQVAQKIFAYLKNRGIHYEETVSRTMVETLTQEADISMKAGAAGTKQ